MCRYVPLASGVPSHDTFGRVFAALDARQFEACFMRWVAPLCPALDDQVVAIDGKTVRGSHHDGARPVHLVSAYGCGLGVVLGQQRTAGHSNEITAIPALLDALVRGAGHQQRVAGQGNRSLAGIALGGDDRGDARNRRGRLDRKALITSAACRLRPHLWRMRCVRTGTSKTASTGCSMWPLARISAACGSRTRRRTLRFCAVWR